MSAILTQMNHVLRFNQEHAFTAVGQFEPHDRQLGIGSIERFFAGTHFHNQHAIVAQVRPGFVEDSVDEVEPNRFSWMGLSIRGIMRR